MTGGDGVDRFVFSANNTTANPAVNVSTLNATDVITDFVSGTDKIAGTGAVAFLGNFQNIQAAWLPTAPPVERTMRRSSLVRTTCMCSQ